MLEQIDVYYDGWGEHWRWGTLVSTTAITGRPLIVFEFSDEAKSRGLELSSFRLPLAGDKLRRGFPSHQLGLPGPVYDSLPDGWGMLLMDRLFKRRRLNPARIGPLERLAFIGNNAMGAMSFKPVAPEGQMPEVHVPLERLAAEVQEVLNGEGGSFCSNYCWWAVLRKVPGQRPWFIAILKPELLPLLLHQALKPG